MGILYVGLPVKVIGRDGIYEVIKLDNFTASAWVNKINSIDHDLREVSISELIRI